MLLVYVEYGFGCVCVRACVQVDSESPLSRLLGSPAPVFVPSCTSILYAASLTGAHTHHSTQ